MRPNYRYHKSISRNNVLPLVGPACGAVGNREVTSPVVYGSAQKCDGSVSTIKAKKFP